MLPQPYDWLLRCTLDSTLILIFVLILFRPLWALAMSRPTLIIVFSRAVANFARLLGDFPTFVLVYILGVNQLMPATFYYVVNALIRTTECALHIHNLALAANRVHAMCFPFHYTSFYAKRGNVYAICFLLWLIALGFGVPDPLLRTALSFSPQDTSNKACMVAAGLCYAALGCRLLGLKYLSSSMPGSSSEKDTTRILVICMACLIMSTLRTVVLNSVSSYSLGWPDVFRTMFYWTSYGTYLMALCTEEVLLAFLVTDFRKNLKRQVFAVFCCKDIAAAKESTTRTQQLTIVVSTRTKTIPVKPINNMVRGM